MLAGSFRRLSAAAACLVLSGCSAVLVRPSPAPDQMGQLACASAGLPWLDLAGAGVVFAATGLVEVGNGIGRALCDPGPGGSCPSKATVWPGYVAAGAFLASSLYGFGARASCTAALPRAPQPDAVDEALRRSEPVTGAAPPAAGTP